MKRIYIAPDMAVMRLASNKVMLTNDSMGVNNGPGAPTIGDGSEEEDGGDEFWVHGHIGGAMDNEW